MRKEKKSIKKKKTKENDEKTHKEWMRHWSIVFRRMR